MTQQSAPTPGIDLAALSTSPRPEDLVEALARSVGSAVDIRFTSAPDGELIDGAGRRAAAPGQGAVEVRHGGRRIALLYGAGLAPGAGGQGPGLDPRAVLLVANAALIAQRRAEIERWYDTRTAVVEAQDAARAQLETDLHDGAQQLVLALLIELRLLEQDWPEQSPGRAVVDAARAQVTLALEELRAIAHGIYPVELDRGGLAVATDLLGEQLQVRIEVQGSDELPQPVRMAVYRLVEAAAEQVAWRGGDSISVALTSDGGLVRVSIGASDGGPLEPGSAADRVVALRGECLGGPGLQAVLPLAISGLRPRPPSSTATVLDGDYGQVVTFDDLRAAGFTETTSPNGRPGVSDTGAPVDLLIENSGTFRYSLRRGTYRWSQDQVGAAIHTAGSGYFVIDGDELILAERDLAMDGRPLVLRFRWLRRPDGSVTLQALDEWNVSRVLASSAWIPVTA